jgi:hypothetical protein
MSGADSRGPRPDTQRSLPPQRPSRPAGLTQEPTGWNPGDFAAWLGTRPDLGSMPRALQEAEYWEERTRANAEWAAAERRQEPAAYASAAWGFVRGWITWARSRITH